MGAGVAIASLALSAMGMMSSYQAQKKQQQATEEANRKAAAAEREQQAQIEKDKKEADKARRLLVDEQRAQLGAGLNLNGITGTKFKKSNAAANAAGATTLG